MRSFSHAGPPPTDRNDLQTLKTLLPYLMRFKGRVALALALLACAKIANVTVPLLLKSVVDMFSTHNPLVVLPIGLIAAYGLARLMTSVFGELRDAVFAKVLQGAIHTVAVEVFTHLYRLSLRFHLNRQTGGMSRDIERGTKGIGFLLNFTVFNILPTLLEMSLVAGILFWRYHWSFAVVTLATIASYIAFTLFVTEWRMVFRRSMNDLDSKANARAIDGLLNYETVKYFGNEGFEIRRYDDNLRSWSASAVKNQVSLNFLNAGQGAIIAVGVTILMGLAAQGVVDGSMSVGDLVLVNAYLLQLYAPLNFLGFVYREIKHSLADMEKMFRLLGENEEVADRPDAVTLASREISVCFEQVGFGYDARRTILQSVDLSIPAGKTLAVVGHSGAGKSTLSRLLFRFYDVNSGRITMNGVDIRDYTQASLRAHIGIVPQDTVLFNDTIEYNIAYGCPEASREAVLEAARAAHIHVCLLALPAGYETCLGERGL